MTCARRLTILKLEIANPAAPDRREPVEFLIDSGAVYSFVSRDVLERLHIEAHGRERFRLADGSTIERCKIAFSSPRPFSFDPRMWKTR